jgi:hypothetical protein
MSEHDPYKVEKEIGEKKFEYDNQRRKERAVRDIAELIRNMPEDDRREVLKEALKQVGSSLEVRKSGKTRK